MSWSITWLVVTKSFAKNRRPLYGNGLEHAKCQSLRSAITTLDYEFKTDQGNLAFAEFMRDNIWRWVRPAELIDTNWYDADRDGQDDYPGSLLDFMFVAGAAKELDWKCEVVVREGDFPDDDKTSDHRPVTLSLVGDLNE